MPQQSGYTPNPSHFGIPQRDGGWIYAVRWTDIVKVGKTTDPRRRLLREARTWCPGKLDEIIAKPFWNITKLEYSLHVALAQHWQHGEWHKFDDPYWLNFFLDGFRQFRDEEAHRDANSIDFVYWMQGTNYAEIIGAQCEHRMTLPEWRRHRGDPWRFTRDAWRERLRRGTAPEQTRDDALLKAAETLAWRDEDDMIAADLEKASPDNWSPLLKAATALAWRDQDDTSKDASVIPLPSQRRSRSRPAMP